MIFKKYNPREYLHNGNTYKTDLYECNNGAWVRLEDCADLEAENATLKEENERLMEDNKSLRADRDGWMGAARKSDVDLSVAWEKLETLRHAQSERELRLMDRVAELEATAVDSLIDKLKGFHIRIAVNPSGGIINADSCEECGTGECSGAWSVWQYNNGESFIDALAQLEEKISPEEPANEG